MTDTPKPKDDAEYVAADDNMADKIYQQFKDIRDQWAKDGVGQRDSMIALAAFVGECAAEIDYYRLREGPIAEGSKTCCSMAQWIHRYYDEHMITLGVVVVEPDQPGPLETDEIQPGQFKVDKSRLN